MIKSNFEWVLNHAVRHHHIPVSSQGIREFVQTHHQPTTLSLLSDALNYWAVDHLAARIGTNELFDSEPTFLAMLRSGNFVFVKQYDKDKVVYLENGKKEKTINRSGFTKVYNGIAICIKTRPESGEPGLADKKAGQRLENLLLKSSVAFFLVYLGHEAVMVESWSIGLILAIFLCCIGVFVLLPAVVKDLSLGEVSLKDVCDLKPNSGCDSLLKSRFAYVYQWVKWTDLGFIYFFGKLLMAMDPNLLKGPYTLLGLAVLPFVFYSLFIQWFRLKQFCLICLSVLLLFLLDGALVLWHADWAKLDMTFMGRGVFLMLVVSLTYLMLKQTQIKKSSLENTRLSLLKIKRNPILFKNAIHQKSKKNIDLDAYPIGLNLTKEQPNLKLLLFVSLDCEGCRTVFLDLMKLIKSRNWRIQLFFKSSDMDHPAMQEAMNLSNEGNWEAGFEFLEYWYADPLTSKSKLKRESRRIARRELERLMEINEMTAQYYGVSRTPMVVVNGLELPGNFNLYDLAYFDQHELWQ